MAGEPTLIIEDLSFRYRSRSELAIQGISLELTAGEILLIAGASGCGKTTLARCINGLIPRSYKGELSGRVLLQGNDTKDLSLARISRIVGTVLQDPERQILGSRVGTEVAFGLENLALPRPEIRKSVDEALAYLGITNLRDRETFNLSGGEKQKVALAGVLAMRPSLLLLDEPLASLDPASALETLALVRRLADEGLAVVMVEHRVEDVLKIRPDRVMFMMEGQIHYLGPAEGLASRVDYREVKLPASMVMEMVAAASAASAEKAASAYKTGAKPVEITPPAPSPTPSPRPYPVAMQAVGREPLVQFENVRYGYESDQTVLQGVSLTINRGDIIAILGPNGAGKTTLVKHAIGLLKPRAGRVLVNGRDTREQSVAQIASSLGYVFQSPSHMLFAPTVSEELAFGPKNLRHRPEQIQKEVNEAIKIVNLSGMEKNPPLSLSFGQQKRVSIAAILAMQSRILVMDEPTAGQDYKNYMSFMDAILQLPGFEAILFITHDVDLAVVYANRVLLVSDGTVAYDGKPEAALRDLHRLKACRLVPTSLLEANLSLYSRTGSFQRAEALAIFNERR